MIKDIRRCDLDLFLQEAYDLSGVSFLLRERLREEAFRHANSLPKRFLYESRPGSMIDWLKAECDRTFPHIIATACEPGALGVLLRERQAAKGSY